MWTTSETEMQLALPEGVALLWSWLQNEQVLKVFLAPPCGSASRARQIPLKRKRFGYPARGRHGPQPLRDDAHPNGLPGLSDTDKQRVSLANRLYFLTAQIVQWAVENGVIVCVENPQFSLFWATTFWQQVAHLLEHTVFHSCQYGSLRQKKTMLAFNVAEFMQSMQFARVRTVSTNMQLWVTTVKPNPLLQRKKQLTRWGSRR